MRLPLAPYRTSSLDSLLPRAARTLAVVSMLAAAAPAFAAGEKDKEVSALLEQAMNEDYLNVAFDKAEKKLKDALKKCGKDGCSKEVLGKVHVALATVYGGQSKLDLAKTELAAALKADPKAALDESLKTPELDKAFAEAKKEAGGKDEPQPKEPKEPDDDGDDGDGDAKPSKKPGGDISHTPPEEQAVNHPVPVYIEVPEELDVTKLILRYKPFGGAKWKSLEMRTVGDGYGVEIPCEDVTTTGDIKYYIIAKDSEGNPAGTAGSLKVPYRVPVRNDIEGDPPSLPGKPPPQKCAVKEDCPPGLPGCPSASGRGEKGWGATCEQTEECQAGFVCLNGSCEEGKDDGSAKKGRGKKNFVSLTGQFDFLLVDSATDVCSGGVDNAYACFDADDKQFYGRPVDKGGTNSVVGGFAFGDLRALLGYDRVLVGLGPGSLAVGGRLGYAFGGSPSSDSAPKWARQASASFVPLHLEVRGSYMFDFGAIHPYGFVGGGFAQVNASVKVNVCDQFDKTGKEIGSPDANEEASARCPDQDSGDFGGSVLREDLDAYQITGLGFIGVGGGALFFFSPSIPVGLAAELKVMFMVPTSGVVFAPTLGPVLAF